MPHEEGRGCPLYKKSRGEGDPLFAINKGGGYPLPPPPTRSFPARPLRRRRHAQSVIFSREPWGGYPRLRGQKGEGVPPTPPYDSSGAGASDRRSFFIFAPVFIGYLTFQKNCCIPVHKPYNNLQPTPPLDGGADPGDHRKEAQL